MAPLLPGSQKTPSRTASRHYSWASFMRCGRTVTARAQRRDMQDHRRGEIEKCHKAEARAEFPRGTEVGRELTGQLGNTVLRRGRVCDFYDPYWRVAYSHNDWEAFTRRELRRGMDLAARLPLSTARDS